MFCITYAKLHILLKRRAFHEEVPTTKITTDTAYYFWGVTHVKLQGQNSTTKGSFLTPLAESTICTD